MKAEMKSLDSETSSKPSPYLSKKAVNPFSSCTLSPPLDSWRLSKGALSSIGVPTFMVRG